MKFKKAKTICLPILSLMAFAIVLFQMPAQCQAFESIEIEIDVSPNVLNIQSQSTIVTVHTDIAYNLVVGATVSLNGVEIDWWKSDDRGYFVAKFVSDAIKDLDLSIGNYNKLVLLGLTKDNDPFIGAQDIMVIDNIPEGGKE